jgi:hypothetical protein
MRKFTLILLIALSAAVSTDLVSADRPPGAISFPSAQIDSQKLGSLGRDQIIAGLKDALSVGVQRAITNLGHTNGFLSDPTVQIPLPKSLKTLEKGLRAAGQGATVDRFVESMNRAAERAVPQAAGVLGESIRQLTLTQVTEILVSTNAAATEYFKQSAGSNLFNLFLPIVQKSTTETGVTAYYKDLTTKAVPAGGRVLGALGIFGVTKENLDVDQYVTTKTLDGLFLKLAEQEKLIRENPQARGTELLQKVFGIFKK